jgi:hypothetical protein
MSSFAANPQVERGAFHTLNLPEPVSTCTEISVTTWMSPSYLVNSMELSPRDLPSLLPILLPSVLWMVAYCFGPAVTVRTRDVKPPGRKRVNIGRRRGKQEHMMPTLISTELQVAAGGLSYVGSAELEMATSDCRRSIDTMHTLWLWVSVR